MEEFSVKVEPSSNSQQTPVDEDLFHDMTPVFQKPKKVSENFTHMLITAHIEGLISNNIIRQYNCKFPCSKCNKSSDSKLGWGGGGWGGGRERMGRGFGIQCKPFNFLYLPHPVPTPSSMALNFWSFLLLQGIAIITLVLLLVSAATLKSFSSALPSSNSFWVNPPSSCPGLPCLSFPL